MVVHLVHVGCGALHHKLVRVIAVVRHLARNLRRAVGTQERSDVPREQDTAAGGGCTTPSSNRLTLIALSWAVLRHVSSSAADTADGFISAAAGRFPIYGAGRC